MIEQHNVIQGDNSEAREALVGRLFGIVAMLESGILARADVSQAIKMAGMLKQVYQIKPYYREMVFIVLNKLVLEMTKYHKLKKKAVQVAEAVLDDQLGNQDDLWFYLVFRDAFPARALVQA
jgi:uncharacterized membrane protein YjfL (UPF0719 family)